MAATTRTEARWRAVVGEQEASGKSVREFADSRGLSAATLYWWRSALGRRENRKRDGIRLARVTVVAPRSSLDSGAGIEVVLGNGRRVRVPVGFDVEELGRLVTVLERGC